MNPELKRIVIAVVLALAGTAMLMSWLKDRERQLEAAYRPEPVSKTRIVVPKRDIKRGEVLSKDNVAARSVQTDTLPDNVVTATQFADAVNRPATTALSYGRPIVWSSLVGEARSKFSDTLASGQRAKTIRVNAIDSFDGLLRPGDRVDLYGLFDSEKTPFFSAADEGRPRQVLYPVLENVYVLATGREVADLELNPLDNPANRRGRFSTITVRVSPREAAKLTLAEQSGRLTAVLRNEGDVGSADYSYLSDYDVFKIDNPSGELVLNDDGVIVGMRLGDMVVDEEGQIIARIVDDQIIGLDGRNLGPAFVVDKDKFDSIVLVRDANGKVIGIKDGDKVVSGNGEVIGAMVGDRVVTTDGEILADNVTTEAASPEVEVVRDAQGKVIGRKVGDTVIGADGRVVGQIQTQDDGSVALVSEDGSQLSGVSVSRESSELAQTETQVVLDDAGRVLGVRVGDSVLDQQGRVVGEVRDGQLVDAAGQVLADGVLIQGEGRDGLARRFFEFIAGGASTNGVANLQRVPLRETATKRVQ